VHAPLPHRVDGLIGVTQPEDFDGRLHRNSRGEFQEFLGVGTREIRDRAYDVWQTPQALTLRTTSPSAGTGTGCPILCSGRPIATSAIAADRAAVSVMRAG
jgi:hypothetical protein